jgi:hypothetical protein
LSGRNDKVHDAPAEQLQASFPTRSRACAMARIETNSQILLRQAAERTRVIL